MTDAIMMMGALEAMHDCRVELTGTTRGQAHNGCLHIELTARWERLQESDLPKEVKAEMDFPSRDHREIEGALYNLCWTLDYRIGQAYEQMKLPGA